MHFRTMGHESCVIRWAHRDYSQGISPLFKKKKRHPILFMFPVGGALPFQFCPSVRTDTHSLGTCCFDGMAGTVRTFPRCGMAATFTGLSLNGAATERRCVERVSISAVAQLPMKLGNVCVTRPEAPGFSPLCDTINLPYRTGCAGRTSGREGVAGP
ncbi:hypothetical protein QR685DRAFT_575030 [Neurospora intermedia]|uniref:Questionable protein n=1 Tax=Neurospora intermedia TaxID=5142 RepID=A0ABR3D2P6_NEUIN